MQKQEGISYMDQQAANPEHILAWLVPPVWFPAARVQKENR